MNAFTMQSKDKIGAWAHMRPPLSDLSRSGIVLSVALTSFAVVPEIPEDGNLGFRKKRIYTIRVAKTKAAQYTDTRYKDGTIPLLSTSKISGL